jgi:hypothetical protein
LLKGVRNVLHTAALASCFPGRRLPVPFWHLLLAARAGESVNKVTPTANVGGEVIKVLLLESHLPREQAAAMVIINKAVVRLPSMLLHFLLGASAPSFADAVVVAVAVGALDQIFFFVPVRLGTLEGSRFMVLSLPGVELGVERAAALAFGLATRVVQLFWIRVGFLA